MSDLNRVTVIGRLAKDAELKSTPSGHAVSKFTVAVNRYSKGESEASFFDVNLWGKQAESLSQYLTKGKAVGIDGELRQERWRQDGQNRSRVLIVASSVQLLGGRESKDDQGRAPHGNPNDKSERFW